MTRFPIYLNYDPTKTPIGFVEIDEETIPKEMIIEGAIVPQIVKAPQSGDWRVVDFGLVQRTMVDTRPREL